MDADDIEAEWEAARDLEDELAASIDAEVWAAREAARLTRCEECRMWLVRDGVTPLSGRPSRGCRCCERVFCSDACEARYHAHLDDYTARWPFVGA